MMLLIRRNKEVPVILPRRRITLVKWFGVLLRVSLHYLVPWVILGVAWWIVNTFGHTWLFAHRSPEQVAEFLSLIGEFCVALVLFIAVVTRILLTSSRRT